VGHELEMCICYTQVTVCAVLKSPSVTCYMMSLGCTSLCTHNTVCYGICRAEGKKPYLIPIGGSSIAGLWGHIEVFRELLEQVTHVGEGILVICQMIYLTL